MQVILAHIPCHIYMPLYFYWVHTALGGRGRQHKLMFYTPLLQVCKVMKNNTALAISEQSYIFLPKWELMHMTVKDNNLKK